MMTTLPGVGALGGVTAGLLVPGLAKRWGYRQLLPGALVLMGLAMGGLALATML